MPVEVWEAYAWKTFGAGIRRDGFVSAKEPRRADASRRTDNRGLPTELREKIREMTSMADTTPLIRPVFPRTKPRVR